MRFSGKERDSETGLDFFDVRYLSGAQGRFTSPDDVFIMMQEMRQGWGTDLQQPIQNDYLSNPQRWNLYSYVWNNPLRYIDPSGREPACHGSDGNWSQGSQAGCEQGGGKWEELPGLTTTMTVNGDTQEVHTDSSVIDWHNYARDLMSFRTSLERMVSTPLPPNDPTLNKPRAPRQRQKYSWGECLMIPHDIYQAFFGGPRPPSDSTFGNGNSVAWQDTAQGQRQLVSPTNNQTKAAAGAAALNGAANAFDDCTNR